MPGKKDHKGNSMRIQQPHLRSTHHQLETNHENTKTRVIKGSNRQEDLTPQQDTAYSPQRHVSTTIVTKGGLDQKFNCKFSSFVSGGKYFKYSFKQTSLEVNIHPIKATYNQRTDQIILHNGVRG